MPAAPRTGSAPRPWNGPGPCRRRPGPGSSPPKPPCVAGTTAGPRSLIRGEDLRVELRGPAVVPATQGGFGGVLPGPGLLRQGPGPFQGRGALPVLGAAGIGQLDLRGRAHV